MLQIMTKKVREQAEIVREVIKMLQIVAKMVRQGGRNGTVGWQKWYK